MATGKQTPTWLDLVQRFERAIGDPVEAWVRSDAYFDVMTQVKRARARVTRDLEGMTEQWLHAFNVPAASDIRRLREQLGRLERTVERLAKDVADREEAEPERPPPPAPKPRAQRAPRPKPKPDPPPGE